MRRCNMCKQEENEESHLQQCAYYWALIGCGKRTTVDGDTCLIEDTDGCPLGYFEKVDEDCDGCIECDLD